MLLGTFISLIAIFIVAILTYRKVGKMLTPKEVHDLVVQGVQAVKDHLDQTGARVVAKVDALQTTIDELKKQLADTGTPVDFSDVQANLDALKTEADGIAPAETPPATGEGEGEEPEPPPPPGSGEGPGE